METVFETLDWFVLSIYFLLLIGVAVWVVIQKNKKILLFFGMTKKVKGLDVLLESLAKVVILDSDIVRKGIQYSIVNRWGNILKAESKGMSMELDDI